LRELLTAVLIVPTLVTFGMDDRLWRQRTGPVGGRHRRMAKGIGECRWHVPDAPEHAPVSVTSRWAILLVLIFLRHLRRHPGHW